MDKVNGDINAQGVERVLKVNCQTSYDCPISTEPMRKQSKDCILRPAVEKDDHSEPNSTESSLTSTLEYLLSLPQIINLTRPKKEIIDLTEPEPQKLDLSIKKCGETQPQVDAPLKKFEVPPKKANKSPQKIVLPPQRVDLTPRKVNVITQKVVVTPEIHQKVNVISRKREAIAKKVHVTREILDKVNAIHLKADAISQRDDVLTVSVRAIPRNTDMVNEDAVKRKKLQNKSNSLFDALRACLSNIDGSYNNLRTILQTADVNALDGNGHTALFLAVGHPAQKINVVRLLLTTRGIDVNKLSGKGEQTPLFRAVGKCMDITIVQMLLSHPKVNVNKLGGSTSETPLIRAVKHNHYEVVKLLLGRVETRLDLMDDNGQTALDLARKNRHDEIVQLFENQTKSEFELTVSTRLKNIILRRQLLALKSRDAGIFEFFSKWSKKYGDSCRENGPRSKLKLGLRQENTLLEMQILAIRRKYIAKEVVGDIVIRPNEIWD